MGDSGTSGSNSRAPLDRRSHPPGPRVPGGWCSNPASPDAGRGVPQSNSVHYSAHTLAANVRDPAAGTCTPRAGVAVCGTSHCFGRTRFSCISESRKPLGIWQTPDDVRTSIEFEPVSVRRGRDAGAAVRAHIGGQGPCRKRAIRCGPETTGDARGSRTQKTPCLQWQRTAVHLFTWRCVPQSRCSTRLGHFHMSR